MFGLGALWTAAKTPIGKILGAVIGGVILACAIYIAGYSAAASASKENQYKEERDAALRDLKISQDAQKAAQTLAIAAEADAAIARKKADDYAAKLPKGTSSDLTADDIKQLQRIRDRKAR